MTVNWPSNDSVALADCSSTHPAQCCSRHEVVAVVAGEELITTASWVHQRGESTEFTQRHIGLWPHKFSITSQHVHDLVRLAQSSNPMPPRGGGDEMHTLLHLLFALNPDAASCPNDPDSLARQLHSKVTSANEAYGLLVRMRLAPLDMLEGRMELLDGRRVEFVKEQIVARLDPNHGLDVDALTVGNPERRLPAMVLLVILRMVLKLRPGFDLVPWDGTAEGGVDHDMLLAEAAEMDDGPTLMHKLERWGFDTRSQGRAALDVLIAALRAGNLPALRVLCQRYPHLHNGLVQEETGMTPLHHLAEGAGSTLPKEGAEEVLAMLFPFSKSRSLDVGIAPSPRAEWGEDPSHAVGTTALMLAISNLSLGVAAALLSAGASVSETNRSGLSALVLAILSKERAHKDPSLERYRAACQMLLEAGATLPAKGVLAAHNDTASPDLLAFCKGFKPKKPMTPGSRPSQKMSLVMPGAVALEGINWGGGEDGDEGLESAARDIQRVVRGGLDRCRFNAQQLPSPRPADGTTTSSPISSPKAGARSSVMAGRRQQEEDEEERAAMQIQRVVRGGVARKKVDKVKTSTTTAAAAMQEEEEEQEEEETAAGGSRYVYGEDAEAAAREVQRLIRGGMARKKVAKVRAAAGDDARRVTEEVAPMVVQSPKADRVYESDYHDAATSIQKVIRGGVARRRTPKAAGASSSSSSSPYAEEVLEPERVESVSIVDYAIIARQYSQREQEAAICIQRVCRGGTQRIKQRRY